MTKNGEKTVVGSGCRQQQAFQCAMVETRDFKMMLLHHAFFCCVAWKMELLSGHIY